jgi:hypothetical protein
MLKSTSNVNELIDRFEYLNNIPETIKKLNISDMIKLFSLTIKFRCYLTQDDMDRYWNNIKFLKII